MPGTVMVELGKRSGIVRGNQFHVSLYRLDPHPDIDWEVTLAYEIHLDDEKQRWERSCCVSSGVASASLWQHVFESASIAR